MELAAAWNTIETSVNSFRLIGRVPLFLLLSWFATLWWGERRIWNQSAQSCAWYRWEEWPTHAEPHHVLLVADPQLVDPHTYPGRPWPLSALTIWITDQYMRRSYTSLLRNLQPDTTIFLGDLFDGGREWATRQYHSPDKQYRGYDASFWLREYSRFMDMFVEGWHKQELHRYPSPEGRRIIASLPGNHDLGFAGGIDPYVKSRFDAHFGPLNRIDVLGNHSFVSLDTVSLSAMDQIDPVTGSSGTGDGTATNTKSKEIWMPVEAYLQAARGLRSKAVEGRFDYLRALSQPDSPKPEGQIPSSLFPTVLLSHVPFFRDADTSCGPLRERGNSIPLAAGYQYQNVLTPLISSDIIKHLDADEVSMIYSGDDHDYCEIEHGEFTGRIKEITVKSTSMAMGVSRPGVQLVSLWNPIDLERVAAESHANTRTPKDTIQNHLCLLPYQQGILLRYVQLLILTLIILAIRARRYKPDEVMRHYDLASQTNEKEHTLLPLTRKLTPPPPPQSQDFQPSGTHWQDHQNQSITSSSSPSARSRTKPNSFPDQTGFSNIALNPRSASPSRSKPYTNSQHDDWGMPINSSRLSTKDRGFGSLVLWLPQFLQLRSTRIAEFGRSMLLVCAPALSFYLWLIFNG